MGKVGKWFSVGDIEAEHSTHCFAKEHLTKWLESSFSGGIPERDVRFIFYLIFSKLFTNDVTETDSCSIFVKLIAFVYYHICSLITLSSTGKIFMRKSIATVGKNVLSSKESS